MDLKEDTIESIFEKYGDIHTRKDYLWKEIPPLVSPPLYNMRSRVTQTDNDFVSETVSYLPYDYSEVSNEFNDIYSIHQCVPTILDTKKCDNKYVPDKYISIIYFPGLSFCGEVFSSFTRKCFSDCFICTDFNYRPQLFNSFFFRFERGQNGIGQMPFTVLTITAIFPLDNVPKMLVSAQFFCVSFCKKLTHNVNGYLSKSYYWRQVIDGEQRFYKLHMLRKHEFFRVLLQTQFYTIVGNYDLSEIVVKGSITHELTVEGVLERLNSIAQKNSIFTEIDVVEKTQDFTVLRKKSPFFGEKTGECEVKVGSNVVDSNLFFLTETNDLNYEQNVLCVKERTFEYILGGVLVSIAGPVCYTLFALHFFTPQFKTMSEQKRKICIENISSGVMLSCLYLAYDIHPLYDFTSSNLFDAIVINMKNSKYIKSEMEKRGIKKDVKKGVPCFPCNNTCLFGTAVSNGIKLDQLCISNLQKICFYLKHSEIIMLMNTSKKMFNTIKESKKIWEEVYNSQYDIHSFNKYSLEPKIQSTCYLDLVNTCRRIRESWGKCSFKTEMFPLFNFEVKEVVKVNDFVMAADFKGQCVIFDYKNKEHIVKRIPENVVHIGVRNNLVRIGYSTGVIEQYNTDFSQSIQPQKQFKINECKGMTFLKDTSKMLSYSNGVSIVDLNVGRALFYFKPYSSEVKDVREMMNNMYVTLSYKGEIRGFDRRVNKYTFGLLEENVTTFDTYGNYIVTGSNDSVVKLWDQRYSALCIGRTVHVGGVNKIRCGNRVIVTGGNDKLVNKLDCSMCWMGKMSTVCISESRITALYVGEDYILSGSETGKVYLSNIM
ncbi:hypothetical protein EIN_154190 [Entamoeba invadens IP1]|uniref:F-box and WD domain protein n=1 Tax=Entamoeba invadens IP1 TaxID=370355 RepID=A0A0A1U942_ENTIV|nr:hypothetical protein EIN_154190 [Entamoeba invadens IP1]ELP91362.1 hypothetical protein EIN_154190 [Entamoeba invadens IP1]|eukprot:XP_004258133.1 hypothetical protein EIN_154190 [Entamoeba invadens IP1]